MKASNPARAVIATALALSCAIGLAGCGGAAPAATATAFCSAMPSSRLWFGSSLKKSPMVTLPRLSVAMAQICGFCLACASSSPENAFRQETLATGKRLPSLFQLGPDARILFLIRHKMVPFRFVLH